MFVNKITAFDIALNKQKVINATLMKYLKKSGADVDEFMSTQNLTAEKDDDADSLKQKNEYLNNVLKYALKITSPFMCGIASSAVDSWLMSDNKCTDGKDDGKIGFFSKVGNIIEGAAKSFVGAVRGIVTSPKKLFKTAATAVVLATIATNPVGAVLVGALGIYTGIKLLHTGIKTIIEADKKAKNATTDSEAKDAYENMGQGGVEVAGGLMSMYAGGKAVAKPVSTAIKNPSVLKNGLNKTGQTVSTAIKNPSVLKNGLSKTGQTISTVIKNPSVLKTLKTQFKMLSAEEAFQEITEAIFDLGNVADDAA